MNQSSEPVDVLVVFAHPDDEIAWFGGIIPHFVATGRSVAALCMTDGGAQGSGAAARRATELQDSLRTCGLHPDRLLWGGFEDCGWIEGGGFRSVDWVWERWGGRDRAREFVLGIYARLQPRIVFTHHPETGDYGHPNHLASGLACSDAFDAWVRDPERSGNQERLCKLYVSSRHPEAWRIDWHLPVPAFAGRTAAEVAAQALRCHRSQGCRDSGVRDFLAFQLWRSRVGPDRERRDFFESITGMVST